MRRDVVASATLAEILQFLDHQQVRATYGAVAGVLGVIPLSMGARLGPRCAKASWIVSADDGLPTGYAKTEMHPALFRERDIISSGTELIMRLKEWQTRREGPDHAGDTRSDVTQRDKMRELFARFGDREDLLVREYAGAERRGEVARASNEHGVAPEDYAAALLNDARKKGWITGLR